MHRDVHDRAGIIDVRSKGVSRAKICGCAGLTRLVNNSDPAGLYEIDTHQFLTVYLANKAGFVKEGATMGENAQGPDGVVKSDGTIDESRSAWDGKSINRANMKDYHFVTRKRLVEMAGKTSVDHMKELGEFFHAQQDTYSHSDCKGGRNFDYYGNWFGMENGGKYGHGIHGHDPDQTWKDKEKAMAMARRVFADMKMIYADKSKPSKRYTTPAASLDEVDGSIPDPAWNGIEKDVEKFVVFPPNVIREHLGYNEAVTFGGYNAKIKLLDSSFEINKAYKGPLPDEVGFKSGTFLKSKAKSAGSSIGKTVNQIGNVVW